ncbi:MAG: hypothetical protein K6E85_08385 [Lachnospiraceae bacterium]|nr:hypothetical protein [Lachnospiraceae bacterium]
MKPKNSKIPKNGIVPESETRAMSGFPHGFQGDMPGQHSEPKYDRLGKCQFCHSRNYPECVKNCKDYPISKPK